MVAHPRLDSAALIGVPVGYDHGVTHDFTSEGAEEERPQVLNADGVSTKTTLSSTDLL
eukprot:CAMPEP_0174708684 /NCGR_PEP_ID=MMETSP1094-20130205/10871_1 /TAXON_ID=156173 /ORGANISM="Chrysochromulina brevifilum, Strain UTEX LB 985" /LENGTH=57 /DNA_ID=CAMNT_0015907273 /DNA_START=192 /DNA_END=361 /DNA_ORIENTATION=+